MIPSTTPSTRFPYTTLFRSSAGGAAATAVLGTSGKVVSLNVSDVGTHCYSQASDVVVSFSGGSGSGAAAVGVLETDRKSTRLNSSHPSGSYAVFCWRQKAFA